ncbi:MAG TPA: LysM domain-containing protein, partial [Pseudonocardia sp.]|nr:LysM domain-containing protein [Pseudonocardia sp.]
PGEHLVIAVGWDGKWRVHRGDNLSRIARELDLQGGWPVLADANHWLTDLNLIYPGQRLTVPGTPSTPSQPGPSRPTPPSAHPSPAPSQTPPPATPGPTGSPTTGGPPGTHAQPGAPAAQGAPAAPGRGFGSGSLGWLWHWSTLWVALGGAYLSRVLWLSVALVRGRLRDQAEKRAGRAVAASAGIALHRLVDAAGATSGPLRASALADAVWDAVRWGVSDRDIAARLGLSVAEVSKVLAPVRAALVIPTARAPRRSVLGWLWGRVRPGHGAALAVLARSLREQTEPLEQARAELGRLAAAEQRMWKELDQVLGQSVRWLLNDPDGSAPPANAEQVIADRLGLPLEVVRSYAMDSDITIQVLSAIGLDDELSPSRFGTFPQRLKLASVAVERARTRYNTAGAEAGAARQAWPSRVDGHRAAVSAALAAALRTGAPLWLVGRVARLSSVDVLGLTSHPASGSGSGPAVTMEPSPQSRPVGAGLVLRSGAGAKGGRHRAAPIRGPPGRHWWRGRFGAGGALRRAVERQRPLRDATVAAGRRTDAALTDNRDARAAARGAAPGANALRRVAESNKHLTEANAEHEAAVAAYTEAITPALTAAAAAGVPDLLVVAISGLSWETVSNLTGSASANPTLRAPWVDPLTDASSSWWAALQPAVRIKRPDGSEVTPDELRGEFEGLDPVKDRAKIQMVVEGRVVALLGRRRMAVYDLSDGHFHHVGYDDPSTTSLEKMLRRLADDGHQGVITFHP